MAKPVSEISLSSTDSTEKYTEEYSKTLTRLQSPIESHFAITPTTESKNSSPSNGFTSVECGQLLCDELDNLALDDVTKHAHSKESIANSDDLVPIHSSSASIEDLEKKHSKDNSTSKESIALSDDLVPIHSSSVSSENLNKKTANQLDDLLSPAEESISMFTQLSDKLTEMSAAEGDSGVDTAHYVSDDEACRPEVCGIWFYNANCFNCSEKLCRYRLSEHLVDAYAQSFTEFSEFIFWAFLRAIKSLRFKLIKPVSKVPTGAKVYKKGLGFILFFKNLMLSFTKLSNGLIC